MPKFAFLSALLIFLPLQAPTQAPNLEAELAKGIQLYQARTYDKAAETLRGVLVSWPSSSQAHYYLGLSLLEMDRPAEAEAELQKALSLAPPVDQVKVSLARVYLKQNRIDAARPLLDQAEMANPQNSDVFVYRGVISIANKDYVGATKALDRALELNPNNAYGHYYNGVAYANIKRTDKMIAHFETFLRLAPNAPEAEKVRAVLKTR